MKDTLHLLLWSLLLWLWLKVLFVLIGGMKASEMDFEKLCLTYPFNCQTVGGGRGRGQNL